MAATVTTDLALLYNANTSIGGATTYSGFQRFGTACNGGQVSQTSNHWTTTVSSFTLVGRRIFTWMAGPAGVAPRANGGFRIVIGDGTNTRAYHVGGSDSAPFFVSGWGCYTLSGDALPAEFTQLAGSSQPNLSALTRVGVGFNVVQKATGNSPNVFWDVMRVGTGLTISGGTPGDPATFKDVALLDASVNNAWGILREIDEGVYGSQGRITIGAASAASTFRESNSLLFFEGVPSGDTFYELNIIGSASHTNEITMGELLGSGDSAIGVAGVTIQSVRPWRANLNGANTALSLLGCTLRGATQGVNVSGTVRSTTFDGCGMVEVGTSIVRDSVFSGYTGSLGALAWSGSTNIERSSFTGNTYGVYHAAGGSYNYQNLTFAGNTYDINFAGTGTLTIAALGTSNTSTFQITGSGTAVIIENSVSLTFAGLRPDSEVRVYNSITGDEVAGIELTSTPSFTYTYNYSAGAKVNYVIFNLQYQPIFVSEFELPANDTTLPIQQVFDRVYENP